MMRVVSDSFTILKRELMIFRSNIFQNVTRSIMFPFILLLIFGNLGNSVSNIPVAIVNYANNQQSLQFISSLQTQNELTIRAVTDQASAFSIFKSGGVDMVIVILPTFPDMHTNSPSVDIYYTNSQFTSLAVLPFIESKAESFGARVGGVSGGAAYSPSNPSAGGVAAVPSFAAAPVQARANRVYQERLRRRYVYQLARALKVEVYVLQRVGVGVVELKRYRNVASRNDRLR